MFILKALAIGSITGLLASIPLGPAGMEAVKRSMHKGFWAGFKISIGAILADYLYIFIIHLGLASILDMSKKVEGIFWIVSGVILFIFNKLAKVSSTNNQENKIKKFKFSGVVSGFLITFLNPSTPSVWIALSGTVMNLWLQNGPKFYYTALSAMLITTIVWFMVLNTLASHGLKKIAKENVTTGASKAIYYFLYLLSIGFIIGGIFKILM